MTAPTMSTTTRRPRSPVRQLLRLTRTEFTLFYRYRTAAFFALFPLIFIMFAVAMQGSDIVPGVDLGAHNLAGLLAVMPTMVALLHVSNVYTARREQLILKRFRASGVPASALFGATTLSVLGVAAVLTAAGVAVLIGMFDVTPAAPVLVLLAIVLATVTVSLLAAAFSRLCRNAESAQMISMLPFIVLYVGSGVAIPFDALPDGLARIAHLVPTAPAGEIAASAYHGYDFFGGIEGAEPLSGFGLWAAAGPSLLIMVAWLAVSVFLLRYVRWDPREAK